MLWQVVQAMAFAAFVASCVPRLWRPKASLNWVAAAAVVATLWQAVHCVRLLIVPVVQLGVAWPPWQLTFEQVSEAGVKVEAPLLALKVASMATEAGATGVPCRASALV